MAEKGMNKGGGDAAELARIHARIARTIDRLERLSARDRDDRPCLDLLPEQIIHETE